MKKRVYIWNKILSIIVTCTLISNMIITTFAAPQTYYVDVNNVSGPWYGTTNHPFRSIQSAIDAASTNDPGTGYHTIYVAPGVYSTNVESFTTLYPPGTDERKNGIGNTSNNTTAALINIDSITIRTNNYLDNLRLIGAGPEVCVIDAAYACPSGRVMYVRNNGVQISGFTLKRGSLLGGEWKFRTGTALLIHGDYCIIENLKCTENIQNEGGDLRPGVIATAMAEGAALAGDYTIIRNVEITRNTNSWSNPAGMAPYAIQLPTTNNLLANAKIYDNYNMGGVFAGCWNFSNVVFGTLVHTTRNKLNWCHHGLTATYAPTGQAFVNCTVASCSGASYMALGQSWDQPRYILNSMLGHSYEGAVTNNVYNDTYFKYNLIYDPNFAFDGDARRDGWGKTPVTGTNIQPATDPCLRNVPKRTDKGIADGTTTRIYVTNNAIYSVGDVIEVDWDKTARTVTSLGSDSTGPYIEFIPALSSASTVYTFVDNWGSGKTSAQLADRNYTPLETSPLVNSGDLVDAATFKYVDVNQNGVYNPRYDVIVKLNGYTPTTNDWVVLTDLAGNPRVIGDSIDRGAYEYSPPRGTVIFFQ